MANEIPASLLPPEEQTAVDPAAVPNVLTANPADITAGQTGDIDQSLAAQLASGRLDNAPPMTIGDVASPIASSVATNPVFADPLRMAAAGLVQSNNTATSAAAAAAAAKASGQENPEVAQALAAAGLGPQVQQQQAAPEPAPAAVDPTAPTAADHAAAAKAAIQQPAQVHRAVNAAIEQDAAEEQAFQAAALKRQQEAQAQLDALTNQINNEVRAQTLPQLLNNGSFANRLLAGVSVALGGYSQGLTGAKTNPALDVIDKAVEQQAERDKLTLAKQEALRGQLMKSAEQSLELMKHKTDSKFKKAQLENMRQEIILKQQEVGIKLQEELRKQGNTASENRVLQTQDLKKLDKDQRERLVPLPNGGYALAPSSTGIKEFKDFLNQANPAISGIHRIVALASTLTAAEKLNPYSPKMAQIRTELGGLRANLRVPILGPGTMQQQEFERLKELTGAPDKFLANPDSELMKLKTVESMVKDNMRLQYKSVGVELPPSKEEQYLQVFGKYAPNVPAAQVSQTIQKLQAQGLLKK